MSNDQPTPTTFDELVRPFQPIAKNIEETRRKHGNEVVSWYDLAHIMVFFYTIGCESLNQLVTHLKNADPGLKLPIVPRSTLADAFWRMPSDLMRVAFQQLLSSIEWLEIPELKALGSLWCIDGSYFPALSKMGWAKVRDKVYGIKLHLSFSLNYMVPMDCIITVGTGNERQVLRQMLQKGITFIADRGYFCFDLLADMVQAHAFFVFRIRRDAAFALLKTWPIELSPAVASIFGHVQDLQVRFFNDPHKNEYRLVIFTLGQIDFFIVTNRWDLTTYQIILLYAYRWQIELIFRFLKHSLNGLQLITTVPQGIESQFYALLITALLHLRFKQDCLLAESAPQANPGAGMCNSPTTEQAFQQLQTQHAVKPASQANRVTAAPGAASFMAAVGRKLRRYWKIGIHWLITLRAHLAQPFTLRVRQALNSCA
jgi:hypothetical protein